MMPVAPPAAMSRPPADTRGPHPLASLRARLLLVVLLATLPASGAILWLHWQHLHYQLDQDATADQVLARALAGRLSEKLDDGQGVLRVIGGLLRRHGGDSGHHCDEHLADLSAARPEFSLLLVTDAAGRPRCASRPLQDLPPAALAAAPWFRQAAAARGWAVASDLTGLTAVARGGLVLARGLSDPAGHFDGVALAVLDQDWLAELLAGAPLSASGSMVVLDADGGILARNPDHARWAGQRHPRAAELLPGIGTRTAGTLFVPDVDGLLRRHAFARVVTGGTSLSLLYGVPRQAAEAPARSYFLVSLAASGGVLLLGLGAAWLAAERLVLVRTRRLSGTAERLAGGDLDARAGIDGGDELGRLGRTFDLMAAAVAERERGLRRANQALRLSDAMLHHVATGIYLVRAADGTILRTNPHFNAMFGFAPGAARGRHVSVLNAPHDGRSATEVTAAIAAAMAREGAWQGEVLSQDRGGRRFWCMTTVWTAQDPELGEVWVAARQDISRLKDTEQALRALAAELEQRVSERTAALAHALHETEDLYENAPCGYHSLNAAGLIVRMNATELTWLGYNRDEVLDRLHVTALLTPASVETFRQHFPDFLRTGWLSGVEFDFRCKDGSLLPVSVNATAVRDADGRFLMSRSTVFDMTEQRAARLALTRANAELAQANQMKAAFLANMSHELRTPLHAIIGFSEVLADGLLGEVTARQQRHLRDIFNAGEHLLALVNDILDLSKIDAGRMTLEPEPLALEPLLTGALAMVTEKAAARGLTLTLDLPPTPLTLVADPRKVRQILFNLLSNAVKFTPDGGRVTLAARRRPPADPAGPAVELSVSDTGIGIAAADLPLLFAAFMQIDSTLGRRYEGTGLGLALVKRLAELHGGGVDVTSEPGAGSTFRVWLPDPGGDTAIE